MIKVYRPYSEQCRDRYGSKAVRNRLFSMASAVKSCTKLPDHLFSIAHVAWSWNFLERYFL